MSAKGGKAKTEFIVEVSEKTMLLPSKLEKIIPEKFPLNGVVMEATGTLSKDGETQVFTARGSNQKFTLKPSEDVAKRIEAGKTLVVLKGEVTEPVGEDGKPLPLPLIEDVTLSESKENSK